MQAALRAVNVLRGHPQVTAVALIGADRTVVKSGLHAEDHRIGTLGATARQIFRQASPPLRYLDFTYEKIRLFLVSIRTSIIVIVPMEGARIELFADVLRQSRGYIEEFSEATRTRTHDPEQAPTETAPTALAPSAPKPNASSSVRAALLRTAQQTLAPLTELLAGPVLRNYVKRSAAALKTEHPLAETVQVDLAGTLTFEGPQGADDHALAKAVGAVLARTLARAALIVPEAAELSPEPHEALALTGFRDAFEQERNHS